MSNCPKCGAEIDHLLQFAQASAVQEYSYGGFAQGWIVDDVNEEGPYHCPECDEVVAETQEEADAVLYDPEEHD